MNNKKNSIYLFFELSLPAISPHCHRCGAPHFCSRRCTRLAMFYARLYDGRNWAPAGGRYVWAGIVNPIALITYCFHRWPAKRLRYFVGLLLWDRLRAATFGVGRC